MPISVEYYTQLERGNARGVSDDVLEAIARVLQLDDTERAHLFDLVRAANARPSRRRPTSMRSEPFRIRWAAHTVRAYQTGTQPFRHPLVGRLDLAYEAFELPADTGQTLIVYAAPPDSPAQEALNLLASWAATPDGAPADEVPDQP